MITLTAFRWVPEFAQGLVKDLRVRWALEEAGIPYQERLIGPEDHLLPERLAGVLAGQVLGVAGQRVDVGQVRGGGQSELLVDPAGVAEALHAGDGGEGGTEGGLAQDTATPEEKAKRRRPRRKRRPRPEMIANIRSGEEEEGAGAAAEPEAAEEA